MIGAALITGLRVSGLCVSGLCVSGLRVDVPVDPDAPTARDWLIAELSKPAYQTAKPTWFDLLSKAIADWLASLQIGQLQGPPALALAVLLVLVALGVVVAILIFGLPRLNRRSAVTGSLFGQDDSRSSSRLREDARAAAARGDYSTAVAEMFRAIARGLAERTIVSTSPGTTAHDFATRAGLVCPELSTGLATAAAAFDGVRYLDRSGTREQFEQLAGLEGQLRATRPADETAAEAASV